MSSLLCLLYHGWVLNCNGHRSKGEKKTTKKTIAKGLSSRANTDNLYDSGHIEIRYENKCRNIYVR